MKQVKGTLKQDFFNRFQKADNPVYDLKPFIVNDLLHRYLVGENVSKELFDKLVDQFDLNIPYPCFCVASFKLFMHNSFSILNAKEFERYQNLSDSIYKHIKNSSIYPVIFYKMNYHTTLIIFNVDENIEHISQFVQLIHDWIFSEYMCESSWGISSICDRIEDIWRLAEESSISTSSAACGMINLYQHHYKDKDNIFYPKTLEDLIINSIKANDINTLDLLIKIIKDENFIIRGIGDNSMASLNAQIINTIYKFNSQSHNFDDYFVRLNKYIIDYNGNYNDYFNYLTQIFHHVCLVTNQKKTNQKNSLISDITLYIADNYKDCNLGLSKVADIFNMSEGYISTIFKEKTGLNFTDYVEALRIKEACRLLNETEKSINDISLLSGYNNVYSFRRAFKRSQSIGPKDFRHNKIPF